MDSQPSRQLRLIAFIVGGESFLLDIMAIRQIVPYHGSTPVPQAPDFVEGIIVLRNEVIPIIDLRGRLFPAKAFDTQQQLVLITRVPDGVIGLKVEEVRRILSIDTASILPPPPIIRGMAGDLFIGVVEHLEEVYLLLDLETVLTTEERRSLREAELSEAASAGSVAATEE